MPAFCRVSARALAAAAGEEQRAACAGILPRALAGAASALLLLDPRCRRQGLHVSHGELSLLSPLVLLLRLGGWRVRRVPDAVVCSSPRRARSFISFCKGKGGPKARAVKGDGQQ